MIKTLFLVAASVAVVLAHHATPVEHREPRAIVRLDGHGIQGNVSFTQEGDKVHVTGHIFGAEPGPHGFHIHATGDITGGCGSSGGHYNPKNKDHGHPNDENRHVGDLGNILFDEQRNGHIDIVDSMLALTGPYSIIGRTAVLHAMEDDYGRTAHPDSKKTGNAGDRIACGVIGTLSLGPYSNGATSSINFMVLITSAILTFFF